MKKISAFALVSILAVSALNAAPKTKYISPNSDGVQDTLEIPLKISEKRFVQSWSLVIMDEKHNVVRTIGNKQSLPEKVGFKQFFKQLVTPKEGVQIPDTVIWNGALDSGETAPDGTYFYYFSATDDNGNEGRTSEYTVVIDTVAPEITVKQPTDKIFGEGAKASFKITQTGSEEDEWVGTFKSVDGNVVKTVTWKNSDPQPFAWQGTDNDGAQVADGVYSYEVTATDRAGNKAPYTSITNIIYSAEKPATNIILIGSRYFSPDTASDKSDVVFDVTIPVPGTKSGNSLTDWAVTVYDEKGKAVRTYNKASMGDLPPQKIVFDGKDNNGKKLPDGSYQAKVTASYLNGYIPAPIASPVVVLDTTKPEAVIALSDKTFGSANKRNIEIKLGIAKNTGAPIEAWQGKIVDEKGKTVKSYDFGEFPPETISWNGINDDGTLSENGKYTLVLNAEDLAGNKGVENPSDVFNFDTTEAQLLLDVAGVAFSPNGDKVKDTIQFTPFAKGSEVVSYTLTVFDSNKKAVYKKSADSALPVNFTWNGKGNDGIICQDGFYYAKLDVRTANGSTPSAQTEKFAVDTVAPSLVCEIPWTDFSPDGDGNQDTIPVEVTNISSEKTWTASVLDAKKTAVKKYTWNGSFSKFEWDGSDESGNKAPDGLYTMVISSTDEAGNSFATELKNLNLDSRETKLYVTAENEGISPNGDGVVDTQIFEIKTSVQDGILAWNFDIRKEDGTAIRSWSNKDSLNLPSKITWDGLDEGGKVCEGTFTGTTKITYKKGNRVSAVSTPFICTATPPVLRVQTAPQYFSPDNDGTDDDLFIKLTGHSKAKFRNWSFTIFDPKGKEFWKTSGKAQITERIIWDGLSNVQKNKVTGKAETVQSATDYPYAFIVTDELGMTTKVEGKIPVDVLVIREGNILKMAVPSIIFVSDASEFAKTSKNLTEEQVANNVQILNRISDILKKFKDYKVTIVGHANRLTDNPNEETVDNPREWGKASTPLSLERAEAIKSYLVRKGVNGANLSTDGKGGTEPVVDPKDKDNNWKNRRVEFILEK